MTTPAPSWSLSGRSDLMCAFCTDEHCAGKRSLEDVEKAYTVVPHPQEIAVGLERIIAVVPLPCCLVHRKAQVRNAGSGLLRG